MQDRVRVVRMALVGLGLAVVLTAGSVGVRRHGPDMGELGSGCGPAADQPCYLPRLSGGWPLAFVIDRLDVPVQDRLGLEDEVRPERFAVDLVFYFGLLSIAWRYGEMRRRLRADRRKEASDDKSARG